MDIGIDLAASLAPGSEAAGSGRGGSGEALAALFAAFVDELLPLDTSGAERSPDRAVAGEPAAAGAEGAEDDEADGQPWDLLSVLAAGAEAPPVAPTSPRAPAGEAPTADHSPGEPVAGAGGNDRAAAPPAATSGEGSNAIAAAARADAVEALAVAGADAEASATELEAGSTEPAERDGAAAVRSSSQTPDPVAPATREADPVGRSLTPAGRAFARALVHLAGDPAGQTRSRGEDTEIRVQEPEPSSAAPGRPAVSTVSRTTPIETAQAVTGAPGPGGRPADQPASAITAELPSATAAVTGRAEHAGADPAASAATRKADVELLARASTGVAVVQAAPTGTGGGAAASGDGGVALGTTPMVDDAGDQPEVAAQLVKAMRVQVRNGIGTARVQLRPEHLGEVQIELTVTRDRVTAVVQAERADVRAQIEAQVPSLRSGLAAAGLHLEELSVREDTPRRDQAGERERAAADPRRRRRDQPDKAFVLVA